MRHTLDQLERTHRARAGDAKEGFERAVLAFLEAVPTVLLQAAERLAGQQRQVLEAMPRSPWWVRMVWPTAQDLQWRAAQVWFEGEREMLRRAAARAREIAERVRPASKAYEMVVDLLRDGRLHVPELAEAVIRLERQYGRTLALIASERRRARLEAREAVGQAASRIAQFIGHQARHLDDWARMVGARLRQLRHQVETEAARLGLS